jgi:hypothetical protein
VVVTYLNIVRSISHQTYRTTVHVGTNNLNLFHRKEKDVKNIRHCDRI